jgi:predicted dehydrogenase
MSEKIKLAFVGCGGISHMHAQNLAGITDDCEVVGLCDIKRENMERLWKDKFKSDPKIKLYDDMDALLKSPPAGLRGITIMTPHTLHFPQCMAALDAGYDVLVEKPMVTSSDHARQLTEKITKTKRHLQVAFQAPFSAEYKYIRDQLKQNGIGELQTVTAFSHQGWRPKSPPPWSWRLDPAMSGGGQMYDTGAHLFNGIAWLVDRPAVEVYCWIDKKGMPVDINAVMTIRWEGDVLGSVTISGNSPGWQEGIWIAGDKGRLVTAIHGGRLEHHIERGQTIKYPLVTQKPENPDQNFVHCLQGKAEPVCPVRYGVLHSWLMDALYQSAREGKSVKLTKPPI